MTTRTPNIPLTGYWIRPKFGASWSLERFRSLEDCKPHVQLTAALLRGDREAALEAMGREQGSALAQDLFDSGATGNLCALVYQRVLELRLSDSFRGLKAAEGPSVFEVLRTGAADASLSFDAGDRMLIDLMTQLGTCAQDVVCLKGTVLSRTLYEQPYFRLSKDFDLLIQGSAGDAIIARLQELGFKPIWDNPGHCHQSGVGPTGSLHNLALKPSNQFESCHNLTFRREGWPYVELKFEPWDDGLKALELDRFFAETQTVTWKSIPFRSPGLTDHLILELAHIHKHGFQGWHSLYDLHLLIRALPDDKAWEELVRRCRIEGLTLSAWAGLRLASDRLDSAVPEGVLESLAPQSSNPLRKLFTFTVSTEFLWNSASLPMLLLNAFFLPDSKRKLCALRSSLLPPTEFLSNYYAQGRKLTWNYPLVLMLHWLVLFLPGGLARRMFGHWIWPPARELEMQQDNKQQLAKMP